MTTFPDFFRAATGHEPYPHQRRLAEQDPLPQLLNIPTGCARLRQSSWAGCGGDGSRTLRSARPVTTECPLLAGMGRMWLKLTWLAT